MIKKEWPRDGDRARLRHAQQKAGESVTRIESGDVRVRPLAVQPIKDVLAGGLLRIERVQLNQLRLKTSLYLMAGTNEGGVILRLPRVLRVQITTDTAELVELIRRRAGHGQPGTLRVGLNRNLRKLLKQDVPRHCRSETERSHVEAFA